MNIVGGIRQSQAGRNTTGLSNQNIQQLPTAVQNKDDQNRSQSPQAAAEASQNININDNDGVDSNNQGEDASQQTIPEEEVELDLDDLTQEDKFYLIQQIEAVQKNIRYYSTNQETYVF